MTLQPSLALSAASYGCAGEALADARNGWSIYHALVGLLQQLCNFEYGCLTGSATKWIITTPIMKLAANHANLSPL